MACVLYHLLRAEVLGLVYEAFHVFSSCFDLGARILQEMPRKGRVFSTLAAIRSSRYEYHCLWPHLGLFKAGFGFI